MFAFVPVGGGFPRCSLCYAVLFSVTLPHENVLNRADFGSSQLFSAVDWDRGRRLGPSWLRPGLCLRSL